MMAAATIGRGSRLTRLVAEVATEHREMDRIWTELRAGLQEISAGEKLPLNVLSVDRFVKLYASHITVEETNVYPLAEMLLSRDDLEQIGASMAERRGAAGK
jgi:hemerythrin-like domain-containing protein